MQEAKLLAALSSSQSNPNLVSVYGFGTEGDNLYIAFEYVDDNNEPTYNPMYNPNGSSYAIEGIISKDGLILGKMGHSERYDEGLFLNIHGNKTQNIFKNGVQYFKEGNLEK